MRTAATLRAPGSGSTLLEARLTLAEFLLGSDELGPCAERTLQWLAANLGLASSLCLLLEPARAQLVALSSYGLSLDSSEYAVELEPGSHPLAGAVAAGEPVLFPAGRVTNTPLGRNAFWAVPIGGRHPPTPLARGLVLIGTAAKELDPQAVWALELLGEKFDRLRHSGRVSEVEASDERALFMSLLNAVTDPILLTDAEGKVLLANSLAERLFLADEKDSEGRRRAVSLNNLLFSSALASQVGEKNEPRLRNELSLVDPNEGSDLLFELLSSPVRQPNGQTVVVSVLRNITDLGRASRELGENYRQLRQAQAEARHERLRLDLVIDSVADPIVVTDPEGDIVLMNAPAERFFTAPSTSEEAMRKVRHNDAHLSSFLSKSFLTDDAPRFRDELSLVDPLSGLTVPMEAVAGKVRSDTGELTTLVTILHDRTEALEKARLYEQLKEASSELEMKVQAATSDIVKQNELLRRQAIALEQASAAKSQFLANMSHEFRTPLNAILGYTNMLLQGVSGELSAPQKKNLMRVDSNGRHLLQVINEILDITRIEAGRMPLHLAEFALPELIAEVIAELEPIIARSTLQVAKELPEKLPKIQGDRQKVKQILLNLMSNALKFTHQGSVRVKAKAMPGRRQLAIAVVDTGIGIAPADHQKVFEDFQQVDASTTRAYGGTGLGLAICRRLAQMMDGNITLESELGKGSTFTLYVPTRPRRK